ncbi:MAG TPA: DsbA family protein [Reyranella sp.]|nr:DsbA family protein [Reyranella sp.]
MRNILIAAGGVVAVAAIVAGVYFGTRPSSPGPVPQAVAQTTDKTALLGVQASDHVLGDPKAPITLIEYASFTCPHCAHFAVGVLPAIKKKWVDTGKVKLIYRDFPLDQTALKAAQLAECSGKDKYFGVIDMIFATQQKWATSSDPIGELSKSLRIAGMGEAEARNCLANDAVANAVIADYRSGETLGVNSTPTLFINGELYKGARSVEELDAAFAKLAK